MLRQYATARHSRRPIRFACATLPQDGRRLTAGGMAMKRRVSTRQWLEANRELLWDLLRVYLGFALVVKGIVYMLHRTNFAREMMAADVPFASPGLAEMVALAHIAGGLMLAFGLLTRIGAAIQIPNLLGAVAFVHIHDGLFTTGQTLEFATLVLV